MKLPKRIQDHHARTVEKRHECLGESSTEVTPATCCCIGSSDNRAVEHDGIPELVYDESGAKTRHEEPHNDQASSICDEETARNKKGTKEQKRHICVLGSQDLYDAAKYKACEDIKGNRCHLSIAKDRLAVFLADTLCILNVHLHCCIVIADPDVLPHHGHQRCESKPSDECKHKAQCSGPECTHVRIRRLSPSTMWHRNETHLHLERMEIQALVLLVRPHFPFDLRHACDRSDGQDMGMPNEGARTTA